MHRLLLTIALLASAWPARLEYWRPLIERHAARVRVEPALLAAIVWQESRGHEQAVGDVALEPASYGLMQIRAFPWRPPPAELLDARVNIRYGAAILAEILAATGGDLELALAAYNGGYAAARAGCCEAYVADVIDTCRRLGGCRPESAMERPGVARAE